MKKLLTIFLALIVLLSGCGNFDFSFDFSNSQNYLNVITPKNNNKLSGKWKLLKSFYFDKEKVDDAKTILDKENIFISSKVIDYKNSKFIDPKITSKYVRKDSYFTSKSITPPEDLVLKDDKISIFKVQDDRLNAQEFIKTSEGKLLIIDTNSIDTYIKEEAINDDQIQQKYNEALNELSQTTSNNEYNDFAVSLMFRKRKEGPNQDNSDYDYFTYFIKMQEQDINPVVLGVDNLVYFKDVSLWSIEHTRQKDEDTGIEIDRIFSNPTFTEEENKLNTYSDLYSKRIDYVDDNYVGITRMDKANNTYGESYIILQANDINIDKALRINNIGGSDAVDNFRSAKSDNINLIANQYDDELVEISSDDLQNIGIKREQMSWKFITNLQARLEPSGNIIKRNIDLEFIPIIDIANNENINIAWKDVISRVPSALDAMVSENINQVVSANDLPEESDTISNQFNGYVAIQAQTQVSIHSINNSRISQVPLVSIQNSGVELVGVKWYQKDEISGIYDEYVKLPKRVIEVLYHKRNVISR